VRQLEKFVAYPPPPIPGEPADLFQLGLATKRSNWKSL
jgi:hypothetical protein